MSSYQNCSWTAGGKCGYMARTGFSSRDIPRFSGALSSLFFDLYGMTWQLIMTSCCLKSRQSKNNVLLLPHKNHPQDIWYTSEVKIDCCTAKHLGRMFDREQWAPFMGIKRIINTRRFFFLQPKWIQSQLSFQVSLELIYSVACRWIPHRPH